MKAIILAAGVGSRLAPLTDDRPKALVQVGGRSLLFRQLDYLAKAGIGSTDVVVVGGYRIDQLASELATGGFGCKVVLNERFADWNNFYSVLCAEAELAGHDFLQLDGDTILDGVVLPRMIDTGGDLTMAVDTSATLDEEAMKVSVEHGRITAVSKKLDPAKSVGEYIGVIKVTKGTSGTYLGELERMRDEGITHEYYEHAIHRLAQRGELNARIVPVADCRVLEIDDHDDLRRAEAVLGLSS